jgi:hypothetical protein
MNSNAIAHCSSSAATRNYVINSGI